MSERHHIECDAVTGPGRGCARRADHRFELTLDCGTKHIADACADHAEHYREDPHWHEVPLPEINAKHLEVRYNTAPTGAIETDAAAGEPTSVDEIVGRHVDVHLEYLGQGWFLEVDGRRFNISDEAIRASEESLEDVDDENQRLRAAIKHAVDMADWIEQLMRNSYGELFDEAWMDDETNPECAAARAFRAALNDIGAGADDKTPGDFPGAESSEGSSPAPPTSEADR